MTTKRESEQPPAPKGRLLRGIEALFTQLWSWGPLYFLIAISLGVALWPVTDIAALRYIVKNDLSIAQRMQVLVAIAISFVTTTAAYLGVWIYRRRREPGLGLGQAIQQANRWAFILLVAPLIAGLSVLRVEVKAPVFTGFMLVAFTALALPFLYRVLGLKWFRPPEDPFVPARLAWLARASLAVMMVLYTGIFIYFSFADHHTLGTTIYDLGIYDNVVWQTANGYFLDCTLLKGGSHIGAHFDPVLWLVAQVYRFYQHAETLLVFQTVWLASGALAVWHLAMHRLRNEWMAAILASIYLLYPGLHGVNMFDFHSLALIVPLMMWAVYLVDSGGFKRYWLVLALLLVTREDISLINCFLGTYAILIGRTRTGLMTILVSLVYLIAVKTFIMVDSSLLLASNKTYSYVYYYEEMVPHKSEGTKGLVITLLTNPLWALRVVFKEEKLLYFLHMLLPLLAVPFAAGRKAVLMIYGFLFIGLASRKHVYTLHFQYSAILFPMFFAALPEGIARLADGKRLRALGLEKARIAWTLVLGMLTATAITTSKYGAIFPNASFKAGWSRPVRTPNQEHRDRYAKLQEWIALIGPTAAVSATNDLGPHVSNRRKAYHWPSVNDADYLLLRTEFFKKEDKKRLERLVKRNKFRLVEQEYGIQLLQRVDVEELEAEYREDAKVYSPYDVPDPKDEKGGKPADGDEDVDEAHEGTRRIEHPDGAKGEGKDGAKADDAKGEVKLDDAGAPVTGRPSAEAKAAAAAEPAAASEAAGTAPPIAAPQ